MASLRDVVRYLVSRYPYPGDLTKTRLTKLVYLADWEAVLADHQQLTAIYWYFDHYGPYVPDVFDTAVKDRELEVIEATSAYGTRRLLITAKGNRSDVDVSNLSREDRAILDRVIAETMEMGWNEFLSYVYSTPPIKESKRYTHLDLEDFVTPAAG